MFKEKRDIVVLIGLEKMLSFATPPPINIGFTREDICSTATPGYKLITWTCSFTACVHCGIIRVPR